MVMKCPKCGSGNIQTESGYELVRYYKDGKFVNSERRSLPRKIFCRDCEVLSEISSVFMGNVKQGGNMGRTVQHDRK